MTWPNDAGWMALADGARIEQDGKIVRLSVVDCGDLVLPVGELIACDPFTGLEPERNDFVRVPPGRYPIKVTLADVSGEEDGSHLREAYASLLLGDQPETRRAVLELGEDGASEPELAPGEYVGFPVDAGTACFVDGGALKEGLPAAGEWYDGVFDSGDDGSWFSRLDDPDHIHPGLANVPLPLSPSGANAILMHSGWGDGFYPVIGGFDASGGLVRVHIDFLVIGGQTGDDDGSDH